MKLLLLITLFLFPFMSKLSGTGLPAHILLQAIEDAVKPIITAEKGLTRIACDPAETLILLGNAPQKWRVIIALDGEASIGGKSVVGSSETTIVTIVQMPVGLAFDSSKDVHRSRGDGSPSILELAELTRSIMRGLKLQHPGLDECYGFSWSGSNWVEAQQEGKPVQFGRQHNFQVVHLIQRPAEMDPLSINFTA